MEIDAIFVGIHIRVTRVLGDWLPRSVRALVLSASFVLSLTLLGTLIALHHVHIRPGETLWLPSNPCFARVVELSLEADVVQLHIHPPDARRYDEHSAGPVEQLTAWWRGPATEWVTSGTDGDRDRDGSQATSLARSPHVLEYSGASKGYFLLNPDSFARHGVQVSAYHVHANSACFGSWPLALLTWHVFGYDSIAINHITRINNRRQHGNTHGSTYTHDKTDSCTTSRSDSAYDRDSVHGTDSQSPSPSQPGYLRNAQTNQIYAIGASKPADTDVADSSNSSSCDDSASHPDGWSSSWLRWLLYCAWLLCLKLELLVTSLFLFFATTTLVSSTLCQTQLRMLNFTEQLRQSVRSGAPVLGLVLEHTMQSLSFVPVLVGILFFLFEFFHDQVLAFMLLMIVWICESFTVLFARTAVSMRYFPKLFALYFLCFGLYFFSFPFGFHYIALSLTAAQLAHAMAYYAFEFEIPATQSQRISIHRPRMLVLTRAAARHRDAHAHLHAHTQIRARTPSSATLAHPTQPIGASAGGAIPASSVPSLPTPLTMTTSTSPSTTMPVPAFGLRHRRSFAQMDASTAPRASLLASPRSRARLLDAIQSAVTAEHNNHAQHTGVPSISTSSNTNTVASTTENDNEDEDTDTLEFSRRPVRHHRPVSGTTASGSSFQTTQVNASVNSLIDATAEFRSPSSLSVPIMPTASLASGVRRLESLPSMIASLLHHAQAIKDAITAQSESDSLRRPARTLAADFHSTGECKESAIGSPLSALALARLQSSALDQIHAALHAALHVFHAILASAPAEPSPGRVQRPARRHSAATPRRLEFRTEEPGRPM